MFDHLYCHKYSITTTKVSLTSSLPLDNKGMLVGMGGSLLDPIFLSLIGSFRPLILLLFLALLFIVFSKESLSSLLLCQINIRILVQHHLSTTALCSAINSSTSTYISIPSMHLNYYPHPARLLTLDAALYLSYHRVIIAMKLVDL